MRAADEPNIIRHRAEKPEPFASVAPWAEKEEPRNLTRAAVVRQSRKAESDNVRNLRIELVEVFENAPLSDQEEYAIIQSSTRETQSKRSETPAVRLGS